MRLEQILVRVLVIVLLASSAACTHVRAWERGRLAHPTMGDGVALPGVAEEHVYSVQEGATGGSASGGGGCGCN